MEQYPGSGKKGLTGVGEAAALRRAVEKPDTELGFQSLDLAAQRRLRQVQLGGGPTEVAVLRHDREIAHEPQIDVHSLRVRRAPSYAWGMAAYGTGLGHGARVGIWLEGMTTYDGKKIVITGGSNGIGLSTAQLFADGGAHVLITGRTRSSLDTALEQLGNKAIAVRSDAASLKDIKALADTVQERFGAVDALFVNAGVTASAPFDSTTEEMYDELFGVNAKGPYFTVQALAPLLREEAAWCSPRRW